MMVQTLEAIKGGGGSIRVGTTGTVGSLMTRELDSLKCKTETPLSSKHKPKAILSNEVGSSGCSNSNNGNVYRSYQENTKKTRCKRGKNVYRTPILSSKEEKCVKKGSNIVPVVDIKCGNPLPIPNRLKKLGFSKLSESAH